jgi:hypothetical protein
MSQDIQDLMDARNLLNQKFVEAERCSAASMILCSAVTKLERLIARTVTGKIQEAA